MVAVSTGGAAFKEQQTESGSVGIAPAKLNRSGADALSARTGVGERNGKKKKPEQKDAL